ncbi:MAG TPA: MarR family transcriptional regulator [Melioribacteraceae bacterium]|nr:MarR family transcriptional regulator [Melioribacteraceae bacterium]
MSDYEYLKLDNQLCFPVYAASRLITREYQPFLEKLNITYPQYLVLMILWESDGKTVNQIADRLILNTNTVTPLLKRMEKDNLIFRKRSKIDERVVNIYLTEKGNKLKEDAIKIPMQLVESLSSDVLKIEDLIDLKSKLNTLITYLKNNDKNI